MFLIRSRFLDRSDKASSGLPDIKGTIEVSARSNFHIKELAMKIYEAAWSLKAPGEPFLSQSRSNI